MLQKIKDFFSLFLYAESGRKTYRKFHRDIANANTRFLKALSGMCVFMFICLGFLSIHRQDTPSLIWNIVYTFLSLMMYLICPFLARVTSHLSNVAAYLSMSLLFLYCIVMGTFLRPGYNSTPFFVVLVAVPIIMADVPWHIMLMTGLFAILNLTCSYIVRPGTEVFAYDLLYTLIFYPTSCFLIPFSVKSTIREIVDRYQLKKDQDLDGLTQLYHRGAARERISEELARFQRGPAAMFMIDVDDFKHINDTYGHMAGDMVLCAVADCIRSVKKDNIIAARYGGDEFILFLYDLKAMDDIDSYAETLIEKIYSLNRKEAFQFRDYFITVSIGIAPSFPKATFEDLLAEADKAVYEAKNDGKNCYRFSN